MRQWQRCCSNCGSDGAGIVANAVLVCGNGGVAAEIAAALAQGLAILVMSLVGTVIAVAAGGISPVFAAMSLVHELMIFYFIYDSILVQDSF